MTKISKATFNELKETFDKAIKEAFGAGVIEGREGAQSTVDEPETIEHEGPSLRKVERKSQTGDFVKYFGPKFDEYTQVGKLYEVFDTDQYLDDQGTEMGVYDWFHADPELEIFEVVVDEIPLQDDPTEEPVPIKSANQQRHELNQRAREFVEENERDLPGQDTRDYGNQTCRSTHYETEFFVKQNKVTAVIYGVNGRRERLTSVPTLVGRSICSIGDVFNEDIGKAIALARALEIEIPEEFLDATQPDEVVKGMTLLTKYGHHIELIGQNPKPLLPSEKIIDDTNAEYSS